ncbi:FmdB family zinc ribbon protein [Mesoterricola silvestris]|uniref:FmdB family zinc ribbon protein n=1 Tax=Mesoterricola silvestris TaxID=2927979 RepID=UPI003742ECA3
MPIYEYKCGSCGQWAENLESMGASAEHDCPSCGCASGMKRQLSTTAFAFAGAKEPGPAMGGSCCSGGGCPFA